MDANATDQDTLDTGSLVYENISRSIVFETMINSEMASMTRIVNGEDCPPGECPWQVQLHFTHILTNWIRTFYCNNSK